MLVIPSRQLLLIWGQDSQQMFMMDGKTTAIVHKYRNQNPFSKVMQYYCHAQQIIVQQPSKSIISIWNTDSQEMVTKVSLPQSMTVLVRSKDSNLLYGGTNHGTVYLWELPSGLLLRKITLHLKAIRHLITQQQSHLVSVTNREVKVHTLANLLIQENFSSLGNIHFGVQIIAVDCKNNLLVILTEQHYHLYTCNNSTYQSSEYFILRQKIQVQFGSAVCLSYSYAYIGDFKGIIHGYSLLIKDDISMNFNRGSDVLIESKKNIIINTPKKSQVCCLCYIYSLEYLISGSQSGQITIWSNHSIKKNIQLFKSSIKTIKVICKPKKDKILMQQKIKTLEKYQMSKHSQPLQMVIKTNKNMRHDIISEELIDMNPNLQDQQIFNRMLVSLHNKQSIVQNQLTQLKKEKQQLISANLHYAQILMKNDSQCK